MRRIFCSLVLILLTLAGVSAHPSSQASAQTCPTLSLELADGDELSKQSMTYTAVVGGGELKVRPTFEWSFTGGKIIAGQGTSTITVGELVPGSVFTAIVQVIGFPMECGSSATLSFVVDPPHNFKFDVYGKVGGEDEMARLDYFAIELGSRPSTMGYLIAYAGRRARVKEASARLERAKDYLVNTRGISEDRIVIIDGGNRQEFQVELYFVPPGANPPVASPTVSPDQVQIIKNASRKTRRRTRGH